MKVRFFALVFFLSQGGFLKSQVLDRMHERSDSTGVSWELGYIMESISNLDGGIEQGSNYLGNVSLGVELDLEKLINLDRTDFSFNFINIHGGSPSDLVGDGLTLSNIDTAPTTRIQNLWLQHTSKDSKFLFRIGKQALDDEFFTTENTNLFLNSVAAYTFGLPGIAPQWPVASLGILGRYEINENWMVQSAVMGSDPRIADDMINNNGFSFYFNPTGYLLIAESSFQNEKVDLKFGLIHDTNLFNDQFGIEKSGLSTLYSVSDFKVVPHETNGDLGLFAVTTASITLQRSRAPFDYDLKAALVWRHGLSKDSIGAFGVGYFFPHVGEANQFGVTNPISTEQILEMTYLYQPFDLVHFQSDLQYIIDPGGAEGSEIENALAFGLRIYLNL